MIAAVLALTMAAAQNGRLCVTNAAQEAFWINVSGTSIGGDVIGNFEFKHLPVGRKHCLYLKDARYEVRLIPGDPVDSGILYLPPSEAGEFCAESDTTESVVVRVVSTKPGALSQDGEPDKFDCVLTRSKVGG